MLTTRDRYNPFQPTLTQEGLGLLNLALRRAKPCDLLKGVVHSYIQIKTSAPIYYPMLPDGTQAIFISTEGPLMGGAQTQSTDFQLEKGKVYFGIQFFPGALRHFFQLNLEEITNEFADFHFIPSSDFKVLHESIYQCSEFTDRARVCDSWLLKHYMPIALNPFDRALAMIYQSCGNIKVNQLANIVGWTGRHLNRQFLLHTGINTKSFIQIIRAQWVFKKLHKGKHNPLNIALEAGYYDQAHFLKEVSKRISTIHRPFFNQLRSDFYNQ